MRNLYITVGFLFLTVIPINAELNYTINLVNEGRVGLQAQGDPRWGGFYIGPDNFIIYDPDPLTAVTMSRCGCLLTSLSTALTSMAQGSQPYYFHFKLPGGLTSSFSPKYLDDFLNIGPSYSSPRSSGWGFAGGAGTDCGVQIYPWAPTGAANPLIYEGNPLFPTGVTWDTLQWSGVARDDIDKGLQSGYPTIVIRKGAGGGGHANLIVGWDNTKKKYLIFDPLWRTSLFNGGGEAVAGTDYRGATEDERYTNYTNDITSVMVLRPVLSKSIWLTILDDPEPIEMRLTDPRGRRTGHDPDTGENIQEDKKAFYSEFTSFTDPLGALPEGDPFRYVAARDPEPGVYGLEVFGTGNAPFILTLATVNGDQRQDLATITGNITTGEVKRYEITYTAPGAATYSAVAAFGPRAKAGNDVSEYIGNTLNFDGRGSYQISGAITGHSWNFGDGTTAAGAQQTHVYLAPGTYTSTLTVTNAAGLTATDDRTILVIDPTSLPQSETIRVNVTSAGAQALGGSSEDMAVTSDGRYVVFQSAAANLVPGDNNNKPDIFVKDLTTGAVTRASVGTGGVEATGGGNGSNTPSISADGRFVSFCSDLDNLSPGSSAFQNRLYVHDRVSGVTELITVNTASGQNRTSLSGDGRYLAYATLAGFSVRDRQLGGNDQVFTGRYGVISEDGQFIAYSGFNGVNNHIFVYARQTGVTEIVSRTPSGATIQANSASPAISGDGRYIAFDVDQGAQVIPGSYYGNGLPDVFLRDRLLGTTERISVSSVGEGANLGAGSPAISSNGRYISFYSSSGNLAPSGVQFSLQVYRRDRQTGTTERSSVSSSGTAAAPQIFSAGSYNIWPASVTSDGSVAFYATATNLVSADTNGTLDIFMRRLVPGTGGGSTTPLANLGGPYLGWATSAAVPAGIRLDGSGSVDPQSLSLTAHWDFGDGSPAIDGALVVTHAYAQPGIYRVTLTVNSGGAVSGPAYTEVEVLPALPADGISVGACSAKGGTIPFDGAAPAANAALIANGWDTSTGPVQTSPVILTLPWGQMQVPTALPGLTFKGSAIVPLTTNNGSYTAAVSGGPSAPFNIPCATQANLPPLAVAGGPIYMAQAGAAVTLNGTASSDPENAPLSHSWDFGDGTFGTGAAPAHTYQFEGSYFVTLVVNDGSQNSALMIGTRSFAMVTVSAGTQQFPFEGFFAPVDNLPVVNLVQAGSAIPLKFSLGGDRGLDISAAGHPVSSQVTCSSNEPGDLIEETVTAGGSSLSYDAALDQYIYVWKTQKAWKGTCRLLNVRLRDGTDHYAKFRFR